MYPQCFHFQAVWYPRSLDAWHTTNLAQTSKWYSTRENKRRWMLPKYNLGWVMRMYMWSHRVNSHSMLWETTFYEAHACWIAFYNGLVHLEDVNWKSTPNDASFSKKICFPYYYFLWKRVRHRWHTKDKDHAQQHLNFFVMNHIFGPKVCSDTMNMVGRDNGVVLLSIWDIRRGINLYKVDIIPHWGTFVSLKCNMWIGLKALVMLTTTYHPRNHHC